MINTLGRYLGICALSLLPFAQAVAQDESTNEDKAALESRETLSPALEDTQGQAQAPADTSDTKQTEFKELEDKLKTAQQESSVLAAQLQELQASLAQAYDQLESLNTEKANLITERDQLQTQLAEAQQTLAAAKNSSSATECDRLQTQLAEAQQAMDEANAALATERQQWQTQLTEVQQALGAAQVEAKELTGTLETSQRQATTLEAKLAAAQPELEQNQPGTHTVQRGESLSAIAIRYYGDRDRWVDILNANRAIIKNPDLLEAGMVLKIP